MIPTGFFLTCGIGVAKHKLTAFDFALMDAKAGNYNHVKVSSVLPSSVERFTCIPLEKGSVVYSAYANLTSNTCGATLSACVAVGIPVRASDIGMIMEHSDVAPIFEVEKITIDLVKEAMMKRDIEIKEILAAPISAIVPADSFLSVFSALVMW